MDTFAALALATERPHPSIIKNPPVRKGDKIMTPVIWRQIYGMAAYQVIVMVIIMFFGEYMWDLRYNKSDNFYPKSSTGEDLENDDPAYNKLKIFTIYFHVFVFLQIFNEVNCRKVGAKAFNIFAQIFSNFYFIGVVCGTIAA